MVNKKALISEAEWIKLRIREGNQIPRERVPHCFGIPVLTLPQCNHLIGDQNVPLEKRRDLCSLRHSCALAYAERLKLDISRVYSGQKDTQYPALISTIQNEERRIKYVPRIGKTESAQTPIDEIVEEVTMASIEGTAPKSNFPKPKVKSAVKASSTVRDAVLDFLKSRDWVTRKQVAEFLEIRLSRRPLNVAVIHKIGLVFLPKCQEKFGYTIDKESRKEDGKQVFYYRLTVKENGAEG